LNPLNKLLTFACVIILQAAPTVWAITCEECKGLEKNRKETQEELSQRRKELQDALGESNIPKAKSLRDAVDGLRGRLRGLEGDMKPCKDACRPDAIKKEECLRIKREIVTMESSGDSAKVDARYRDLAKCNVELRRLLKQTD
jgi:hypothetical protein